MTLRDLDPVVWAATFGAAFAEDYRRCFTATDAPSLAERHAIALQGATDRARIHTDIADAAALSLHPDGLAGAERRMREIERLARGEGRESIGERLARATVHPEAIRAPLPLPDDGPAK